MKDDGPLFVGYYRPDPLTPPPGHVRCRRCGAVGEPDEVETVSRAGWAVFALLLLSVVGAPLAGLGLRMTERRARCRACGGWAG